MWLSWIAWKALVRGRAREKVNERLAVRFDADGLFRHFGAGRVVRRPDFEQLRNRFLGPNNVEFLQGRWAIVARKRRDTTAENVPQRRTGLLGLVGAERVAGDTGAKHFSTMIAGIPLERILRYADQRGVDRLTGNRVPTANDGIRTASQ